MAGWCRSYEEHVKIDALVTAIILAGMFAKADGEYKPSEDAIDIAFDCTRTIMQKVSTYVEECGEW